MRVEILAWREGRRKYMLGGVELEGDRFCNVVVDGEEAALCCVGNAVLN